MTGVSTNENANPNVQRTHAGRAEPSGGRRAYGILVASICLAFTLGCRMGFAPLGREAQDASVAGDSATAGDGATGGDGAAAGDGATASDGAAAGDGATASDGAAAGDDAAAGDVATAADADTGDDADTASDGATPSDDAAAGDGAVDGTEHAFGFGVFSHGDVGNCVVSPDGTRVYFVTDMSEDGRYDLFGVDLDGDHLLRVHPPLAPHQDIYPAGFRLNDKGTRLFFRADLERYSRWDLYTARPDGTDLRRLSGWIQALGDVSTFTLIRDTGVVFLGDLETDAQNELYVVESIDAATADSRKINPPLVAGGNVVGYWVSADGEWIVFRADAEVDERYELYAWSMSRGVLQKINPPLIDGASVSAKVSITADNYVVFRSNGWQLDRYEIQLVAMDGTAHTRVSEPIASGGRAEEDVLVAPDGRGIFFRGDLDTPGTTELYVYNRGLGARFKLNSPLPSGGDVTDFRLAGTDADRWVIFRADQHFDQRFELVAVNAFDGTYPIFVDPDLLVTTSVATDWHVTRDGGTVVYRIDRDGDGSLDLFTWRRPVADPTTPRKVSGDLVSGGNVSTVVPSPTSDGVAFVADATVDGINELFYVDVDGDHLVRLSTSTASLRGGQVSAVSFTPDGSSVLFVSDHLWSGALDLFVNTVDGSNLLQLNPKTTAQEGFSDRDIIQITPDSTRMVAIHEDPAGSRLVSANLDGTDFAVLSGSHPWGHRLMPDSRTVVFDADSGPSHLFAAQLDGSNTLDIGGAQTSPAQWGYSFTANADRVVFLATPSAGMRGLYAVRPDGGAPPLALHDPAMIANGDVESAVLMPDGIHAIYSADEVVDGRLDLVKVSLDGQTRQALSTTLDDVNSFDLTPDGQWVVATARPRGDVTPGVELYSINTLMPSSSAIQPSGNVPGDRSVVTPIQISADSGHVVFVGDLDVDDRFDLYATRVDGGLRVMLSDEATVARSGIDAYDVALTPDSRRVIFLAKDNAGDTRNLYSVALDGSGRTQLSHPTNARGSVYLFRLSKDSKYAVFLGDQEAEARYELFSVRLEDGVITKLSPILPLIPRGENWGDAKFFGTVFADFRISEDSQRVYFRAQADSPDQTNLYAVGIDGQTRTQINPPLPAYANVLGYRLSPNDAWVLYFRNDRTQRDVQFYSVGPMRP